MIMMASRFGRLQHDRTAKIAGAVRNRRQRFEIAGIGQLVDHENGVAAVADRMTNYCRADESRHRRLRGCG
jgi:hypothetical protein